MIRLPLCNTASHSGSAVEPVRAALATSVLIPSLGRTQSLARCLESLCFQSVQPDEVLVIWQGDDIATERLVSEWKDRVPYLLRAVHASVAGIVAAENRGLAAAGGNVVFLIDDDAAAPQSWIENHLRHYCDPSVGAVGGPIRNVSPDGKRAPERHEQPVGRLRWYGKFIGNGFDHPASWRNRAPIEVDHLAGSNFSLRRSAFSSFDPELRPYWQCFEADVSLQVKSNRFRILFDFANPVDHWPSGSVYVAGRHGDLTLKVLNAAFNEAYVLSKHSRIPLRWIRWAYLLLVGAPSVPGLFSLPLAIRRYGNAALELRLAADTIRARWAGWRAGAKRRNWRQSSMP
jgi:glycosyltransferase involved in cell wall biosynthesis